MTNLQVLRIMQRYRFAQVPEKFGLLNVATPHTVKYSEEDLELLESVAFQIGSTIKRIELTNQEKEAARLNERNRLARDLHDSVNQMLFIKTDCSCGIWYD